MSSPSESAHKNIEPLSKKWCVLCENEFPIDRFRQRFYMAGGLNKSCYDNICKSCKVKNVSLWRKKNPEKTKEYNKKWYYERGKHAKRIRRTNQYWIDYQRDYDLKRAYGITLEDYKNMLKAQNGCCAICGKTGLERKLVVDHNHTTGKIRGLLCDKCNIGLHYIEQADFVKNAFIYLRK